MAHDSFPLIAEWALPSSVTLGSSVRAKGIERELRRRLSWNSRKHLTVEAGRVVLSMPEGDATAFASTRERISTAMDALPELPLLPSEVEDVLAISSRERHKWLGDGRLQSAGTRTVKLRGRARAVTFHVFDPRHIETILDGDLPTIWREEDAQVSAENRRRAAGKAALARANKVDSKVSDAGTDGTDSRSPDLDGWDAFDAERLLR
ncbi:hypothetical protein DWF00_28510 [Bosea caraganae]|uniref:Uncharacterized protein n=2 Tax=Bosea caraganae TaxID=2763117 RepID=A0A370L2T8_9HYPH|nr:hypothetical protein [Bosea caraganae]RDJ20884.1 hypothetical protein DWF00_28510 [Bosea caraganae]RDJ22583.1 hypothetical protein DWE98_19315 [Bosea caraganae]